MAKNKNVRIVNRKKNTKRKSYADEKKLSFTPEVKSVFWTCLVVAIVLGVFYLITIKATGGSIFKKDEEDKEVEFQYSEILVGRSFDLEGEYYVLYYDMSDTECDDYENLDNAIHEFEGTMGGSNFYKCDLSNAFNKPSTISKRDCALLKSKLHSLIRHCVLCFKYILIQSFKLTSVGVLFINAT